MLQVKFIVRIRALEVAYCVDTCKEAHLITASEFTVRLSSLATTAGEHQPVNPFSPTTRSITFH